MGQRAKTINEWYKAEGLLDNTRGDTSMVYLSPYLNIYSYPLELDYTDLRPNPPKFVRLDTLMIKSNEKFEIPEKLKNKPRKLIFFSMGSLSSINVDLMKSQINYLVDSPHRFIASKGMLSDEYELPLNCWGDNFVPQTVVLQIVDFAIIHGGNNSLYEAFYYGKPVIVMPVFADQPDNTRVHEKGFGIRIDPFKCTKEELLESIEKIANNNELHEKIKLITKRSQRESKSNKISEMIEEVVANARKSTITN